MSAHGLKLSLKSLHTAVKEDKTSCTKPTPMYKTANSMCTLYLLIYLKRYLVLYYVSRPK